MDERITITSILIAVVIVMLVISPAPSAKQLPHKPSKLSPSDSLTYTQNYEEAFERSNILNEESDVSVVHVWVQNATLRSHAAETYEICMQVENVVRKGAFRLTGRQESYVAEYRVNNTTTHRIRHPNQTINQCLNS